ncbi:hypothetical protein, partial [Enterobacter hormaechei]|uniref:hypothetical protein n=1 Tax=Enterobacter hormaechei TaxID=158836 RepID=UPI002E292F16
RLNTMIVRRMAHININKYLPTRRRHMKILVRVSASTDYDVYPLFMVKCDGLNDEEIQAAIERNLVEYTGMDADSVYVDDDGVCWHNGSCWYVDDTMPVSDEDAAHLERILGISTFE